MTKRIFALDLMFGLLIAIPIVSFAQWSSCGGLENRSISGIVASHTNLIAGDWNGFLYLSIDSGATWTLRDTVAKTWDCPNCGLEIPPVVNLFANDSEVFAGAGNIDSGGVHTSTDDGITWTEKDPAFAQSINCFTMKDGIIFAGTNRGVFHSTDDGLSWNPSASGLSKQVVRMESSGTNLFAGTSSAGVFLSDDDGASWRSIDSGLTGLSIYGLAAIGTNIFAAAFGAGVYYSSNEGANWGPVNTGLTNHMLNILISDDSSLLVGTNIGVFLSTNAGGTWVDIYTGTDVDSSAIISLALCDGYLFAGTNSNGLWRRPLSQIYTSVKDNPSHLPSQFALKQNYPNPFNPTTIISYQVPTNGMVRLEIYDMLGRKIRTLVNENQHAGVYSVMFNAAHLPSGAYFYRITTGSFIQTKKLLVMK